MEKKKTETGKISNKRGDNGLSGFGPEYEMIVFSHLRWGFVFQRPQHLITRMSQKRKVLFVEEPIPFEKGEENTYELEIIAQNLHVFKPKVQKITDITKVLHSFLKSKTFNVGWFYSSSFSPLICEFNFQKIVYDCMDELSLFRGADPELVNQEKFLLSEADIVFTGGKSLYDSKSKNHGNVHCFQSSVEREHFSKALENIDLPEDIKHIKKPIVGYFGVIDERLDLNLLSQVALLRPTINFVMIGPIVKIGEEEVPKAENIHYLGMKPYAELPHYLKAFDIAMMPFALNEATKFISPTKTLEYMAAGKPIISTAIKDVVRDYSHCIPIVDTAQNFSDKIDQILESPQEDLLLQFEEVLDKTSWDATASAMDEIIERTVR